MFIMKDCEVLVGGEFKRPINVPRTSEFDKFINTEEALRAICVDFRKLNKEKEECTIVVDEINYVVNVVEFRADSDIIWAENCFGDIVFIEEI